MSAVFRMSFILVLFHMLVFLICLMRNQIAAVFHDGWWMFKFITVLASSIASFYISNDFFEGYAQFVRVTSVFFLIYQGICMLSLSYVINNAMVEYWSDSHGSFAGVMMIIITLIIYVIDLIVLVFQFIWFSGCALNIIILCLTIIFGIIFTVLVVLKTRDDSSILTNAFVMSYALFLSWSAMASRPEDSCNPFVEHAANTLYQIGLGLVFTVISLMSISLMTKSEDGDSHMDIMSAPLVEKDDGDDEVGEIAQVGTESVAAEDAHVYPVSWATVLFHVLMMFA
jgi:hypothetical protein